MQNPTTAEPAGSAAAASPEPDIAAAPEPAMAAPGAATTAQLGGTQQSETSANERIEAAVQTAREAAEQQAQQADKSSKKQKDAAVVRAGVRARWDAMTREVRECGDLRTAFKLSDDVYAAQIIACRKAYTAVAKARGSVDGEVPSDCRVPDKYTPISCGWKAVSGHAARDFKLLVGTAMLELIIDEQGLPSLDIICVKTHHGKGGGYVVLVYASIPPIMASNNACCQPPSAPGLERPAMTRAAIPPPIAQD